MRGREKCCPRQTKTFYIYMNPSALLLIPPPHHCPCSLFFSTDVIDLTVDVKPPVSSAVSAAAATAAAAAAHASQLVCFGVIHTSVFGMQVAVIEALLAKVRAAASAATALTTGAGAAAAAAAALSAAAAAIFKVRLQPDMHSSMRYYRIRVSTIDGQMVSLFVGILNLTVPFSLDTWTNEWRWRCRQNSTFFEWIHSCRESKQG
jgi:hypothetical protein